MDPLAVPAHLRPDTTSTHPLILDPSGPEGRAEVERLLREGHVLSVHDTFEEQVRDLVTARFPSLKGSPDALEARVREWFGGKSPAELGRWIFYPWSRRLVHLLQEPEYRELRTDRNRHKLSHPEQALLRSKRLGVAGLSVGLASALTLATEGVGGAFHLADFDTLGVSNLNRLRAGVQDLGVRKTVIAARQLLEIDPYLEVVLFPEGVTDENLDAFLGLSPGGRRVDLLVEECDELSMKIRLRERARQARMPVIMETSDRGLLDVERFDLEPDRPLLHGRMGNLTSEQIRQAPPKDRMAVALRILDGQRISPLLAVGILELGATVSTWPQLASSVALGGAVATDTARRVLLGSFTASGRYYVDLDGLVREGSQAVAEPEPEEAPPAAEALAQRRLPQRPPPGAGPITRDELRTLVGCAVLAPSYGNRQPWRFHFDGKVLRCAVDEARARSAQDPALAGAYASLGAAVENLALGARALGFATRVSAGGPDGFQVELVRQGPAELTPLMRQLTLRGSNHRLGTRRPLGEPEAAALRGVLEGADARLELVSDDGGLAKVAEVLGAAERLQWLTEPLQRERARELRWTADEVLATRDGVDVATLELDAAERSVLRLKTRWPVMEALSRKGLGAGLERRVRADVSGAAALGLLTVDGAGPEAFFRGGRALERVWLAATGRGLAVLPYPLPWLAAAEAPGSAPGDLAPLRALLPACLEAFGVPPGRTAVGLLRFAQAPAPSARSLRRSVDAVLRFD